jgi:NADPH:quinone reductase-like Zn-dependent oxidoreductase
MTANSDHAVTFTAREQAELLPIEQDQTPLGPRQVAGRTLVSLISAGTELAGAYQGTSFPRVPGYAAVFEVEAVGDEVEGIGVGDHAFCMGPHRSFSGLRRRRSCGCPRAWRRRRRSLRG